MIDRDDLLDNKPFIIGGPCSVAGKDQIVRIAKEVKSAKAHAVRVMLWKPRTKPDSFQGVGDEGLAWIKAVKDASGLPIVTEVMSQSQVELTKGLVDVLWVGARNMQNYDLLKAIKKDKRPVILKRGLISKVEEWLGAADYIGKNRVILCERGIRTGADAMRFTLDLNAVLVAKYDQGMPVIVDPSHSPGRRDMVPYLAMAAIATGADGLVVETHYDPEKELVDKDQTISTKVFKVLVKEAKDLYEVVKKPDWRELQ